MKVALIGNIHQAEKSKYLDEVIKSLRKAEVEILAESQFLTFIDGELGLDVNDITPFDENDFCADFCLSIGGDGTFLKAAAMVENKNIPILGINTGHLGFLTEISLDNISEGLNLFYQGRFRIEERTLIAVYTEDNTMFSSNPYALNEVAILKHDNSSLIHVKAQIDGIVLNNYVADGLIVTTPTGSTGYSLSVGGPILAPTSSTLCISPVASHSLNTRPVVITDNVTIQLDIESRTQNFLLAIDGRSQSLPSGTPIYLKKAPHTIGVVRLEHQNFYDTLRNKMGWGSSTF
ncbi:MAG: NAD kinase [Bacteroidaceae bacterium]|nr:NAD kinase [Bacteroidaceae bacterium]